MSKPKLEFKQVIEDGVIPGYEKPTMSGFDEKEYGLRVPRGKSFTVTTDEPCVIPLGISADIPKGWHVAFTNPPMTKCELSFGEDNEWILTVTRKSEEVSFNMVPQASTLLGATLLMKGLSVEKTNEVLNKPRRVQKTYTLDGRITFVHLEGDENE